MQNFLAAAGAVLEGAWDLLTAIEYPGTGITIAAILIGSLVAVVGLRFIGALMGVNYNASGVTMSILRSSKQAKISKERKADKITND